MSAAVADVWPYVAELFEPHEIEQRAEFDDVIAQVFDAAGLVVPDSTPGNTGRDGGHTEAMAPLLAEMQSVARAHPDATW
jgi:ring-1,2-phenylacetyl-CoA epoxidase subunit PaaC